MTNPYDEPSSEADALKAEAAAVPETPIEARRKRLEAEAAPYTHTSFDAMVVAERRRTAANAEVYEAMVSGPSWSLSNLLLRLKRWLEAI